MSPKPGKPVRKPIRLGTTLPEFTEIELELVVPNPVQARTNLDDEQSRLKIASLADSIEQFGLQQPILVRRIPETATGAIYQIVAGERRFRAHQKLERERIPALIFDESTELDEHRAELVSLIENVQRENLDALDLANAIKEMHTRKDGVKYTLDDIGKILGMSKPTLSKILGILKLDDVDTYYLKDYQTGVFEEIGDDKEVAVRPVREVVSLSALSEFSFVARSKECTKESRDQMWSQIRIGKLTIQQIRESSANPETAPEPAAPIPPTDEEPTKPLDADQAQAKLLKTTFKSLERAAVTFEALPSLTPADRDKLSQLIERMSKLLESK